MMARNCASIMFVAVLFLAGTTGCRQGMRSATAGGADTLRSGVRGHVVYWPVKPVGPEGKVDSAALAGASIFVQDRNHTVVARVVSDSLGEFFVALPEGTHYFVPQAYPDRMFPHPFGTARVYVPADAIVSVTLNYDSGIR